MRLASVRGLQLQRVGEDLRLTSPSARRWYDGRALADPRLAEFLLGLPAWTGRAETVTALARIAGVGPDAAGREVDRLIAAGLLITETPRNVRALHAERAWTAAGWRPAFEYQVASDAVERLDYTRQDGQKEDVRLMREQLAEADPPPAYLDRSGGRRVALPPASPRLRSPYSAALRGEAPAAGCSLQVLTDILWYGFGEIGKKKLPVSGAHIRKTSPSGGSRHPTEGYLAVFHDGGLPRGLYHYNVQHHALDRLPADLTVAWANAHVLEKPEWAAADPCALILLTSEVARNRFRYRENFSYRPVHHDAGHVLETVAVTARAAGMRPFTGYSVDDAAVSAKLGTHHLGSPPVGFIVLGGRRP